MTAPDLCRLASAAFPGVTFKPIDIGRACIAQSAEFSIHHRPWMGDFTATVRGQRTDYQSGTFDTIEAAHADALACRAEHEHEPAPTVSAPAQLPLF